MSRLDLVVFGATGYTGKHAVRELTQLIKKYPGLTWGIAGRSQGKLEKVLQEVSKSIDEDVSSVPTIVADVGDEQSLRDMCSRTRIVVNCCGPYRFYGEPVVKAAVESRTHYVDVNGEPQFMERMQPKYNEAAREAGVYVVSACGFDSIPVDLGVIFLQQNFTGTVNSVETYLSASSTAISKRGSAVNYGTWESLVYGITHMNELRSLRKKLYPSPLPPLKPKLQPRGLLHRHQSTGSWCLPFPGADASVAYRTQRALYESDKRRPAQVRTYVQLPSLLAAVGAVFFAAFTYLMTRTSFTRKLLLDYPAVFTFGFISKESPSEEVGRNTTFAVDLHARGWAGDATDEPPNKTLSARVSGVNPGYGMTVVALLLSAFTVLTESDKMPSGGGVMTTGVAFRNTGLIGRLNDNNVKFQIVKALAE